MSSSSLKREKLEKKKEKMETQRIIEFPHKNMDKRPRKRPRLTWDMPPPLPPPKVVFAFLYGFLRSLNNSVEKLVLFIEVSIFFYIIFYLLMKNLPNFSNDMSAENFGFFLLFFFILYMSANCRIAILVKVCGNACNVV